MLRLALIAGTLALAPAAMAVDHVLYVGDKDGDVLAGDPVTGGFSVAFNIGVPVTSLAAKGTVVFATDASGEVWKFDSATGGPATMFADIASDATAMVVDGTDLLISGTDSKIHRVEIATGKDKGTMSISDFGGIKAMTLEGSKVWTGDSSTFIYRGTTSGSFQSITACGGVATDMAIDGQAILISTSGTDLYRLDKDTGSYFAIFSVPSGGAGVVMEGGDLLLGVASGKVYRLDHLTGATKATLTVSANVQAITLGEKGSGGSCKPDFTGDGKLDINDYIAFQSAFFARETRADINQDGRLNIHDFVAFHTLFKTGC